jgi:hypothetical protein
MLFPRPWLWSSPGFSSLESSSDRWRSSLAANFSASLQWRQVTFGVYDEGSRGFRVDDSGSCYDCSTLYSSCLTGY